MCYLPGSGNITEGKVERIQVLEDGVKRSAILSNCHHVHKTGPSASYLRMGRDSWGLTPPRGSVYWLLEEGKDVFFDGESTAKVLMLL